MGTRILLACSVLLSGCASSPWNRADCARRRHNGYNVLVCADEAAGQHCAKGSRDTVSPHVRHVSHADNGKVLDYQPRACTEFRPMAFGRKPNIVIGRSYMDCLDHEIAHLEHPNDPAWVERNFPCVGDRRR